MALTRITKGVIKPNENYDTHNINSTGIVTAIGLDVNGNGDISGNLSVGGVLTYEDVTSIDSVGIITARGGIDCNGDIDVDGHTNLDNVSIAGVTTFTGITTTSSTLFADHFSTSGIGTFADIHVKNPTDTRITSIAPGALILSRTSPVIFFKDNLSDSFDASIELVSNEIKFQGGGNGATSTRMVTTSSGVSFPQDIDVDGHTNLDNVSVAGVTTFAGDIETSKNIVLGDGSDGNASINRLKFGASGDLQIYHNQYHSKIVDGGTGALIISGSEVRFETEPSSTETLRIDSTGRVGIGTNLFYDSSTKLEVRGRINTVGSASTGSINPGNGTVVNVGSLTSHSLQLMTANATRIKIAHNSAATSIGGSNVFNAMLTVQGDLSGELFHLKATEGTSRLMVSGTNTNGVEMNLYDEAGGQKGILGVSGTEFFIKAPNNSAPLTFYTHNGSSIGERLRIDSSGRLLIGKTSGDHILDINASNSEIRLTKTNASHYNGIQLDRDASGNAGGYFGLAGATNHYITGSAQHDICVRSEANLLFSSNGATERLRIGSEGNLALGGTNTSAYANQSHFFIGGVGNLYGDNGTGSGKSLSLSNNAYINTSGNWVYRASDKATNIYQYDGRIGFRTATSGTAGNTISWSEKLRIDSDGVEVMTGPLDITSSGSYTTHFNYNNTGSHYISMANGGATYFRGSSNGVTALTVYGGGGINVNGNITAGAGAFTGNIDLNSDTNKLKLGAGDDFQLYHNGSSNYIWTNNGNIRIMTTDSTSSISLETNNTNRFAVTDHGGTVVNKDGTIHADSGYCGLEVKANSSEHHLVLSSIASDSSSNYSRLGFKLHPSNQNERIKAAIICQGNGGGYGQVGQMMFCLDDIADNGSAEGNGDDERFRIATNGVQIHRDERGWSTIGQYTGSARLLRRHYREFATGSSSSTFNLIRVRRHYWGWGHYKFRIMRGYYSGIVDSVYYLNGHGRNDGSYNPSYVIEELKHGGDTSNFNYSNRITITSPSNSSPGNDYAMFVDVQLQVPAYMYFTVEVEAYTAGYSLDTSSLGDNAYALFS